MDLENLTLLKKMLRRIDRQKMPFNMIYFILTEKGYENFGIINTTVNGSEGMCGTACCAAGYAIDAQEFKDQGLFWFNDWIRKRIDNPHIVNNDGLLRKLQIGYEDPHTGLSCHGLEALKLFWGLTTQQAEYIFFPSFYARRKISPRMVISHIDKVITSMKKGEAIKLPKNVSKFVPYREIT
jgi:hypothetical protein